MNLAASLLSSPVASHSCTFCNAIQQHANFLSQSIQYHISFYIFHFSFFILLLVNIVFLQFTVQGSFADAQVHGGIFPLAPVFF